MKLFPAGSMGSQVRPRNLSPLGHIDLMVTGGINPENAAEHISAGAAVVEVGSYLTDRRLIVEGRWDELQQRSAAWLLPSAEPVSIAGCANQILPGTGPQPRDSPELLMPSLKNGFPG